MFRTLRDVGARIDSGKSMEVVDEMRLIEIAAVHRHGRPFNLPPRSDPPQDPLESTHAAKQFRRETYFAAEHLDEALGAQPDLSGHLRDGAGMRQAVKLTQREGHRGVPVQPLRSLREQDLLQDEKLSLRSAGLEQPLAQLSRQTAPQVLERYQRVVQLTRRRIEKRKGAAWFEVYAGDGILL